MSAAIKALEQAKFRLEEDLEDRRGQQNHLQSEVLKVRKTLEAAETGLANHEAGTAEIRQELSEVRAALAILHKGEDQ